MLLNEWDAADGQWLRREVSVPGHWTLGTFKVSLNPGLGTAQWGWATGTVLAAPGGCQQPSVWPFWESYSLSLL